MALVESTNIPLKTKAIDFSLKGINGKSYSLQDFENSKILVIVFMCNHCPYVQAIWQRLNDLQKRFQNEDVQFIGINPNMTNSSYYDEENLEKMKEYADEYNMNFPYLADETQEIARAYKAQCTPDIYVFNENRELIYHGRVDDNWQNENEVQKEELAEALEFYLKENKIIENQNPSMGCSIKWDE